MFYRLKELDLDKELDNKYSGKTIVSIAAGKTINDLKEIFGCQKYIRVMPNTPALISCGATAIARDKDVDDETFNNIKNIFESIGVALEIPEDKFIAITGPNGSGKSTLVKVIMGIAKPDSGKVLFNRTRYNRIINR